MELNRDDFVAFLDSYFINNKILSSIRDSNGEKTNRKHSIAVYRKEDNKVLHISVEDWKCMDKDCMDAEERDDFLNRKVEAIKSAVQRQEQI